MILNLTLIKSGKTQTLNNVISISEMGNIVQVKTTNEEFKVNKENVEISVTIESRSEKNRDSLMDELNAKMDILLEFQEQDKLEDPLQEIDNIKEFIKTYKGVSTKDKEGIINYIDELVLTLLILKKK